MIIQNPDKAGRIRYSREEAITKVNQLLREGGHGRADTHVAWMLREDPAPMEACLAICKTYLASNEWRIPLPVVERMIRGNRTFIRFFIDLSRRLADLDKNEEAIDLLKRCLFLEREDHELWDELSRHLGHHIHKWREIFRWLPPIGSGARLLDLGSNGDFDLEMDTYPFADGFFDVVLAPECIEQMFHDPMFLIAEANRVLKPGGTLLLTTHNIVSFKSLQQILNGKAPYHEPLFKRPHDSSGHSREFTPWEVETLFRAGGFEVEEMRTMNGEQGQIHQGCEKIVRDYEDQTFDFMTRVPMELRGEVILIKGNKTGEVKKRYPDLIYEDCWDSIVL